MLEHQKPTQYHLCMGFLCEKAQFIVSGINAHQNDKWEKYVISQYIWCA